MVVRRLQFARSMMKMAHRLGPQSLWATPSTGFEAIPVTAAEIARNFPTFLPGGYGYYGSGAYSPGVSPFLQTETKTLRCFTGGDIIINRVAGQVDSQPPSQLAFDSLPTAPYANYAEGGGGYYARHIKHIIKH